MTRTVSLLATAVCVTAVAVGVSRTSNATDEGPFAPSQLRTASGEDADPDAFYEAEVCGECHTTQFADWTGSMHSRAHHDSLYLAFANLAREQGGDDLYRFCSSCHAPGAVATREIPGPEDEHTFLTDEGVTCDVCHHVNAIVPLHHGGGANASIVLSDGEVRFGPIEKPIETPAHESAHSELHTRSEFCSACHTLTHPHNGVVIENTYQEWKEGPYAKAGIQCQDCHMRTVEQALQVARSMKPLEVPGPTIDGGEPRPNVHAHTFVGGNANRALTGSGEAHAAAAKKRLQTAASLEIRVPETLPEKGPLALVVAVTNDSAGHAIPTSITELREVWIDLSVADAAGKEIFRSGAVDDTGRVDPGAVMYHAVLHDAEGKVTYLPWKAAKLASEKLIPPKTTLNEAYAVRLPEDAKGPFAVKAVLRYRSAPQNVMDELFGKGKYPIETIDMATAKGVIPAR